ncbi:MAG: hypothetical protein AB7O67_13345 [Vicinamibacterales bacterium]
MPAALLPGRWTGVLAALWLAWLIAQPVHPSVWLVVLSGLPLLVAGSFTAARRAGRAWAPYVAATSDGHMLALALVYCIGVLLADTHGITSDGAIYFSQLRSLIFDHDLDVAREFAVLGQPPRPHYVVPIGPTLLWLPAYGAVALVDALGRVLGAWDRPGDPAALGLGLPYIRAVLLTSYAVGAMGLAVLHARLRERFTPAAALITSLLVFGATPLFWYMVYEPSMTHAASFGVVAAFVVLASRWVPGATTRQALVLGAILGLAFLTRPQQAVFAIYPGLLVLTAPGRARERTQGALRLAGWAFAGALPFLLLQGVHAWVLFSMYPFRVAGDGGYLALGGSRVGAVLFSSWHGFLSWTPVAYIAVIGTVGYLRREWRWATSALLVLGVMAWINGAAEDWAGGWSFGGRRFTSTLVLLAPGLALVVDWIRRRPLVAIAPLVAGALLWNHLLMVQYTAGMVPKDGPVSFGQLVRQQAELHTRAPYFYPWAFPANAWFAWRQDLPIDRYDLLSTEPLRTTLDLTLDRQASRFLLDGWEAPGGDTWGSSWWIGGTPATLAVPLALPEGRAVAIEVEARTRFEEPTVVATLALEVNGEVIGEFVAGADAPTTARLLVPATAFHRIWRQGYNRVAFVSRGVARTDPADSRPPGPIAAALGSRPWPVAIYRIRIAPVD